MATRRTNVRVSVPIPPAEPLPSHASVADSAHTTMNGLDAPPAYGSAWLPTLLESCLIAIYPATLIFGSLFSTLTVDYTTTPYLAHIQAYDPAHAPSYFAKKSNFLNIYFVKVGWAWVTLSLLLFIFASRAFGPVSYLSNAQATLTRRRGQALARWALLTAIWFAFTQAFFGASLIDRGFRWTGGMCDVALREDIDSYAKEEQMSRAEAAATHAACRLIGGQWRGGHDISGHVFLLVMGSAMLWFEVLPVVLGWAGLTRARVVNGLSREGLSSGEAKRIVGEVQRREHGVIFGAALAVAAVSWWMLLMTAAYFHTWFEKLTGLLVALSAIYLAYFVPRAIPAVRQVLGLPGV